jgi:hypothetical protein
MGAIAFDVETFDPQLKERGDVRLNAFSIVIARLEVPRWRACRGMSPAISSDQQKRDTEN